MNTRKWPWGRIVAGAIAVAALACGIGSLVSSVESRRRADAAQLAEPIHLKVDLSKPGTYTTKLVHSFSGAHGDYIQVVTEPPLASAEEARAIVEGLRGKVVVTDGEGGKLYERPFGPKFDYCIEAEKDLWVPIIDFGYFAEGVYELTFTVDHGAPRLAGVPHALVGRYGLCGVEYIPAEVLRLLGIAGCTIAGLLILAIALLTIANWRTPTGQVTPANKGPVEVGHPR